MKKVVLVIFLGLALTAFCMGSSQAAVTTWYTCTVYSTGPVHTGGLTYYVAVLTDTAATPAFTQKAIALDTTIQKELLATMLTALASGKKVKVLTNQAWVYAAWAGDY